MRLIHTPKGKRKMSIKDEVFDLLDGWNDIVVKIRDDPDGIAADLADDDVLEISLKTARELVSKWLDLHSAN